MTSTHPVNDADQLIRDTFMLLAQLRQLRDLAQERGEHATAARLDKALAGDPAALEWYTSQISAWLRANRCPTPAPCLNFARGASAHADAAPCHRLRLRSSIQRSDTPA